MNRGISEIPLFAKGDTSLVRSRWMNGNSYPCLRFKRGLYVHMGVRRALNPGRSFLSVFKSHTHNSMEIGFASSPSRVD